MVLSHRIRSYKTRADTDKTPRPATKLWSLSCCIELKILEYNLATGAGSDVMDMVSLFPSLYRDQGSHPVAMVVLVLDAELKTR